MDLSNLTDEELTRELAQGRDLALTELVRRWEKPLRNYVRRRCFSCHRDADDLLQDVFLRVYTHIRDFDAGLSFSAWIFRMTHNVMVSRIRKHAVRGNTEALDPELVPSHVFRTDGPIEMRELQTAIITIQERMPDKLRDAFVLRFLEEKEYAEIGDILRENENTIATRIRRAREFFMTEAAQMGLRLYLEK